MSSRNVGPRSIGLIAPPAGDPAAGAPGTVSYDSGAAGLTFGSVSPGDTKDIDFSGADDGEIYAVRLVFSGDITSFNITRITKVTKSGTTEVHAISPEYECGDGEDFVMAFDEPSGATTAAGTIRFAANYTDGTAQTMQVEIYDAGSGTLIDTINATATVEDPVIAEALTNASFLGAFVLPPGTSPGDIVSGDYILEDGSGTTAEKFRADLDTPGNKWAFDADAPSSIGALARGCILSPNGSRGTEDYAGLTGSPGAVTRSGLIIFKIDPQMAAGESTELYAPRDFYGAVRDGNTGFIYWENETGPSPYVGFHSQAFGCGGTRRAHGNQTTWLAIAFRTTDAGGGSGNVYFYVSEVGQLWKNVCDGAWGLVDWDHCYGDDEGGSFARTANDGGSGNAETGVGVVKWGGVFLFSADIGESKLRDLFEAITP